MKVLVISLYYEPDLCQANGPIVRALCDDLADAGHAVTVITSFPHYNCTAVWPQFRGQWFQDDRVGAVRVLRGYIYVPRGRSTMGRMLNYVSFNASSVLAGLWAGPQDVIFALSPPLTNGLTAYVLGKLKGAPHCYNLQDIWPEAAVRLGVLRGRRAIKFWELVERFIYRKSSKVFAISEEFKRKLLGKGVAAEKIEVIPNFVDTDLIRPLPKANAFSVAHGLTDKFVVLYAGNIGLSQGLEVVLDAAARLCEERELVFLFVGAGACRAELMAAAARRGLANVRFLPLQPQADVPLVYASCDLSLIPLRRGVTETSVPCKTYSIMASGRPFIAGVDEGSNIWKLAQLTGCGVCVPPEDGAALAAAVKQLKAAPERARTMGRRGREYVEHYFARTVTTKRYRLALEALVEPEALPTTSAARGHAALPSELSSELSSD